MTRANTAETSAIDTKTSKMNDKNTSSSTQNPQSQQEERWSQACSNLKSALTAWDELSKAPPSLSQDEKQKQEVKDLLKALAKQVADLS